MPWQLIYTSAPRGLSSGQSGFCTVARSADVREALAQRLEQFSSYHYLRVAEAATANRNPTISAFRVLDLRGAKYYILTRIQPCGLDFTARTNHLAHHLVFQPDELAGLPSPAAILRLWPGWVPSWQGEPRVLEALEPGAFAAAAKNLLPAQTWARLTGDGGRAAGLLESECVRGCYLVCPPGSEEQVLAMYGETLQLLNFNGQFPLRPWRHTFTSFLQAEDNPGDFQWRACQENTPAYKVALTRSAPMIVLNAVRVPGNSLVKLARGEPNAPPLSAPSPAPNPPPSGPVPNSALKTLTRGPSTRSLYNPPPMTGPVNFKKSTPKPAFLDLNFSVNTATLAGLGIFVAVLAVLVMIKHHSANRPVEEGTPAPVFEAKPLPVSESKPKMSSPITAVTTATPLDQLTGDGPTYVLTVANLTSFSLPISSIMRFQNLLHRYDHFDTLPSDIQLAVDTDRWDFPPGASMIVDGRANEQFSASTPGLDCVFDYADWLAGKGSSLKVQASFKNVPGAFSLHFGFSSSTNGDPFRLLFVNENNPPAPLRLARKFVQDNRQNVRDSLAGPAWACLDANFKLLAGRQWQLRPYFQPRLGPAHYLYEDWPANEAPLPGCELDFTHIAPRLQAQRQDLKKSLDSFDEPLRRPLGQGLELTNSSLESFLAFSDGDLTRNRFLDYLKELKKNAPTNSWIVKWNDRFEADQPDEISDRFQKLYELWSDKRPRDQPMLTFTNASGTTNYFSAAWQLLEERQQVQEQLENVKKRLVDLDHVAYVGLCIVDPMQSKAALEMIRFEGP